MNRAWWRGVGMVALAAYLLIGVAFADDRLHPDEAFFLRFARHAAVGGDWALTGDLDKPPLTIYAHALALAAWAVYPDADGVLQLDARMGEVAARYLGVLWSLIALAAALRLYRDLIGREAGDLAGLVLALSPSFLLYGASAFMDMPLLALLLLAYLAAWRGRMSWAGMAWGLAFCAKTQALYGLPLLAFFTWRTSAPNPAPKWRGAQNKAARDAAPPHSPQRQDTKAQSTPSKEKGRALLPRQWREGWGLRFFLGAAFPLAALLLWDAARPVSHFALGAANNLAGFSTDVPPLLRLLGLLAGAFIAPWSPSGSLASGILLSAPALWAWATLLRRRKGKHASHPRALRYRHRLSAALLLYSGGYVAWHGLAGLNFYDRYLLLILPWVALFIALGWQSMVARAGWRWALVGALLLVAAWPARQQQHWMTESDTDMTQTHDQYGGVDALAAALNALPVAAVVYDPYLGWPLDYYLGEWHNKRRVYYPDPASLAAGALALPERGTRYFVAPSWVDHSAELSALRGAGFGVARLPFIANPSAPTQGYWVYALQTPAS